MIGIHLEAYDVDGNLVGSRRHLQSAAKFWAHDELPVSKWSAFKSETEISYIDITQAVVFDENFFASEVIPWSIVYDNMVFGAFADAHPGAQYLSTVIPLPASAWFFLTGLLGFGSLRTKRKLSAI